MYILQILQILTQEQIDSTMCADLHILQYAMYVCMYSKMRMYVCSRMYVFNSCTRTRIHIIHVHVCIQK